MSRQPVGSAKPDNNKGKQQQQRGGNQQPAPSDAPASNPSPPSPSNEEATTSNAKPSNTAQPQQSATAPPALSLFLRFKEGAAIRRGVLNPDSATTSDLAEKEDCRDCLTAFSADGALAAIASTDYVYILATATGDVLHKLPEAKVTDLQFSPLGTYLVCHRPHDPKIEAGNMAVLRVNDGSEVFRAVQAVWPCMQWSADEKFLVRQLQQRLMVHDGDGVSAEAHSKIELSFPRGKEASFAVSPTSQAPFVAIFRPQTKVGTQAGCSVCRLPVLTEPLFQHNFGKGDSAKITWSKSGAACTVLVHSATDTSHQSYYGTTTLWAVHAKDRAVQQITLAAGESVHDCQWSPTADEFIVVHGIMPRNKATLFSAKGEAIYSFGESPRNLVKWSPNGKMFVLGGSGGLNGDFQFYDRTAVGKRGPPVGGAMGSADGKLGFFSEKSTTQMWSPCSRYLLCCNVFRLLRQDNRYVIWKHTGERLVEEKFPGELHGCDWIPEPASKFPDRAPSPTKVTANSEEVKPKAYRPPGAPSAAAAMLARPTSAGIGGAVKAKPTGPVGAAVEEPKKRRR